MSLSKQWSLSIQCAQGPLFEGHILPTILYLSKEVHLPVADEGTQIPRATTKSSYKFLIYNPYPGKHRCSFHQCRTSFLFLVPVILFRFSYCCINKSSIICLFDDGVTTGDKSIVISLIPFCHEMLVCLELPRSQGIG